MKTISEKLLDDKLCRGIKALGGIALKLICLSFTGLPDRTILLPPLTPDGQGRVFFVELKTTGKKPSPRQDFVIGWLRKLGFKVYLVDDEETLEAFFNDIKTTA